MSCPVLIVAYDATAAEFVASYGETRMHSLPGKSGRIWFSALESAVSENPTVQLRRTAQVTVESVEQKTI